MTTITGLPHLTASGHSWRAGPWIVAVDSGAPRPLTPVLAGWDYNSTLDFSCEFHVDMDAIRRETRLPPQARVEIAAVIDCPTVNHRWVGQRHLLPGDGTLSSMFHVTIPAGEVADALMLERQIVLCERLKAEAPVPRRPGAILASDDSPTKVTLEGDGGRFPIELADFGRSWGCAEALWILDLDLTDPSRAFLGAARLYMNREHPVVRELLSGDSGRCHDLESTLMWDVKRQMVERAVDAGLPIGPDDEQGTVGAVLWSLIHHDLGFDDLSEAKSMMAHDRERFEGRLQSHARLFG